MALGGFLARWLTCLRRGYWWVVRPRTRGVRVILVRPGRRVLLVRHSYRSGWFLPGGGVLARESGTAAIRRELREELAINLRGSFRILGVYENRAEYKHDTVTIYIARCPPIPTTRSSEIADRKFFNHRRLPAEVSPGTRRRLEEWSGLRRVSKCW